MRRYYVSFTNNHHLTNNTHEVGLQGWGVVRVDVVSFVNANSNLVLVPMARLLYVGIFCHGAAAAAADNVVEVDGPKWPRLEWVAHEFHDRVCRPY
jgi:hypothetical protein